MADLPSMIHGVGPRAVPTGKKKKTAKIYPSVLQLDLRANQCISEADGEGRGRPEIP